ncbi:MAG: hemerythrin domain-containing protein [Kofleriaceae bacterium]
MQNDPAPIPSVLVDSPSQRVTTPMAAIDMDDEGDRDDGENWFENNIERGVEMLPADRPIPELDPDVRAGAPVEPPTNLEGTSPMSNRIDQAIAKTKGAAKGVKARVEGLTGIFATLAKQHGEAGALLDDIKRDASKRRELWPKVRVALLTHERAEMRVLYPELRMHDQLRALANSHDAEAAELERMIHDLDETPLSSDTWGNLFERLADTVVRHAGEEERDIFPLAQRVLGKPRAKELGPKFEQTQKSLEQSA